MRIPAGEEIGEEVHDDVDQVIAIVDGSGEAVLDDVPTQIDGGDLVLVPAGTKHNVRNVGTGDLKLYTVYAPPEHPDGTVHRTRAEADAAEH
jgi:mannose-6-phosphate isomerase-like protein (cupin superfamily)